MKTGWKTKALCLGMGSDLWFDPETEEIAKAICEECPVRRECLDMALRTISIHGVWGGTTERERKAILRGDKKVAP